MSNPTAPATATTSEAFTVIAASDAQGIFRPVPQAPSPVTQVVTLRTRQGIVPVTISAVATAPGVVEVTALGTVTGTAVLFTSEWCFGTAQACAILLDNATSGVLPREVPTFTRFVLEVTAEALAQS